MNIEHLFILVPVFLLLLYGLIGKSTTNKIACTTIGVVFGLPFLIIYFAVFISYLITSI